jgi:hypothetical protein
MFLRTVYRCASEILSTRGAAMLVSSKPRVRSSKPVSVVEVDTSSQQHRPALALPREKGPVRGGRRVTSTARCSGFYSARREHAEGYSRADRLMHSVNWKTMPEQCDGLATRWITYGRSIEAAMWS